jgi:hypothetical protein
MLEFVLEQAAMAMVAHIIETPAKVANVTAAAGVAGANAAASVAATPFIGPALAAAAMAQTSALVLGTMMPLAAAARGFDVGDYAPVTQLHPREMVLPAELANRIRNMTDGGGSYNITIHAVDGKSVERLFNDNQGPLIRALSSATKNRRSA